ncbi:MAG: 50S ribosomal protein L16 [Thermoplasmata archaeon]|nr:50S ribosomal protein L16 [Thermoplasmata archaeon]
MSRKPGRMYRYITGPAYTRREYMGGVPGIRVAQFVMGNRKGRFTHQVSLVVKEACQIRHTALEAARVTANKFIQKKVGGQNYKLQIRVYPHHVLRENKQATGAGADRVSQGMRKSFGKPVGTAARVRPGQEIITLEVNKGNVELAKIALRKAGMKIPSPWYIVIRENPSAAS